MRKREKKMAEEFLGLLESVHLEIRAALETGKRDLALTLLEQCQQGAIQLGELLEKAEGEGCPTVRFLEEYCEQVYQIFGETGRGAEAAASRVHKTLKKHHIRIENSLKADVKVRLEAVFLPYKASMWDSMESVWRAADADPDCDAYVVPIPYYDKNPDGSFREMHYEGGDYPKDVPIVWYQNYDFAQRRPDAIFIHNAYDEENYVTSVSPQFYTKNLKNYTDQLVYIPYFVLGEILPGDEDAKKSMEHFCLIPGVFRADKIIVQSEAMRQVYIDILTRFAGAQTKRRWEETVLGLGSPKYDRAAGTRTENLDIPEEWLRIIRRPDGSRKKVVFYNTSVSALLRHNGKMLLKINAVLRAFQENADEVALLWRPHPLMQATIRSMRPALWQDYQAIVARYRREAWGIYDDSADVNRAIALSDAYYGDPSSVVQLFQTARKPVLTQDVEFS